MRLWRGLLRVFGLGVAQGRPEDTALSLLKRVDNALYAAKHAGRDRVVGD